MKTIDMSIWPKKSTWFDDLKLEVECCGARLHKDWQRNGYLVISENGTKVFFSHFAFTKSVGKFMTPREAGEIICQKLVDMQLW